MKSKYNYDPNDTELRDSITTVLPVQKPTNPNIALQNKLFEPETGGSSTPVPSLNLRQLPNPSLNQRQPLLPKLDLKPQPFKLPALPNTQLRNINAFTEQNSAQNQFFTRQKQAADDTAKRQAFLAERVLSNPTAMQGIKARKSGSIEAANRLNAFTGSVTSLAEKGYAADAAITGTVSKILTDSRDELAKLKDELETLKVKPLKTEKEQKRIAELSLAIMWKTPMASLAPKATEPQRISEAQRMNEGFQADRAGNYQALTHGLNKGQKFAVDATLGTVDMVNNMSLAGVANAPLTTVIGINSATETMNQNLKDGYSGEQVLWNGLLSGGISAGIESIGGIGGNAIGKLAATNAGKQLIGKIPQWATKASNTVGGRILKTGFSEGAEEFTEYPSQWLLDKAILKSDTPYSLKDQLNNTFMGATIGGVFGGVNVGLNSSATTNSSAESRPVLNPISALGGLKQAASSPKPLITPNGTLLGNISQMAQKNTVINDSVRVGKATTIKSPYAGEKPIQQKSTTKATPVVSADSVRTAALQIKQAKTQAAQTGKSLRNYLTDFYSAIFDNTGGARGIEVDGVKFGDKNYVVTVNKNAVSKVIADNNLSVEKLAIFDVLDDVIENGEFVGSGNYIRHGNRDKKTTRFDYFETPVTINDKDYTATFDVEVFPGANNYRTHKVVNNMDLVPISRADTVPLSAASEKALSPSNTTIAQGNSGVNNQYMQKRDENVKDKQKLYAVNQDLLNTTSLVKGEVQSAYQHLVSGQSPLERMSKANSDNNPNIDAATQLSRQAGGTVDHIAEKALVSRGGKRLSKSYVALMKEIPRSKLNEFNDYAQNLHNIDRMSIESRATNRVTAFETENPVFSKLPIDEIRQIASVNDDSGVIAREYLNLVEKATKAKNKPVNANTIEKSTEVVESYELANPNFRATIDNIQSWWDTFGREWTVGSGLMNEDSYNAMREMYPYYVPTFRVDKQGGFGRGVYGKTVSTPKVIKKAIGGTSEIIPLEESFMAQIDRTVKAARRNELYQAIVDFAVISPEKAAPLGVKLSEESGSTFDTDNIDAFLDDMDTKTLKQLDNGGYQLTVLDEGKPIRLDISKEVWDGLRWLQDKGLSESFLDKFVKTGQKLTSPTKAATTGINALFAITNTVRDFQSYFVNSIAKNPLELFSNYGKAIYDVIKHTDMYNQYTALGGSRSGFYGQQQGFKGSLKTPFQELSTYKKLGKVVTVPITVPFKAAAKLGEFTEKVPRMAEFRNAVNQYGDSDEGLKKASFAAADVTVNFSRNAPITKMADAWTMYLNAQVQGLDKTARQIKNHPIASLTKAAIAVTFPTLLLQWLNKDNPYYDELDNRTKDGYFLIPNIKDVDENNVAKTFIKIPKSREWGVLLGASFDRLAQYFESRDLNESFRGFGNTLLSSFAPTDFTTGNFIAPITQNIPNNKDWAGRSIVPRSMENLEPRYQYDINTSGIAKNIGERLNLSPKQIDYLIDSYAGYPGDVLQGLTSPQNKGNTSFETARNAVGKAIAEPFERRFTANPLYSSAAVDKFYSDLDKAKKAAATKSFAESLSSEAVTPEDKKSAYLNKISLQISELRKQEKAVLGESISSQEKKAKTEKIRSEINELARNAEDNANEIMSEYAKIYVPEISHLSEKRQASARNLNAIGLDYDKFLSINGKHKEFDKIYQGKLGSEKNAATEFSKYLDNMPLTKAQREKINEDFKYWTMMPEKTEQYNEATLSKENAELFSYESVKSAFGGKVEDFIKVQNILSTIKSDTDEYGNSISGTAKPKEIEQIAKVLNISTDKATDIYNETVLYKHNINDLTTKEQKAFQDLSSKNMSSDNFLKYSNLMKTVESIKDNNGKTVNGSLKLNRLNKLLESGMPPKNARYFLTVLYGYQWG